MTLAHWFHHLVTPHCEICKEEADDARIREEEARHCASCTTLRSELDRAHRSNEKLLEQLLQKPEPIREEPAKVTHDMREALGKAVPWRVKKQILETDARKVAALMKENKVTPVTEDDLEKELASVRENAQTTAI